LAEDAADFDAMDAGPVWRKPRRRRNPLLRLLGFGVSSVYLLIKLLVLAALVFCLAGGASYFIVQRMIEGKEIVAPAVQGYSLEDAAIQLNKSAPELSLKVDGTKYSEMVNDGAIISQYPPAGSRVKAGSAVRVVISKGNSKVNCPNVEGMNYLEAGIALRKAGLKEGNKSFLFDPQVKKDCVVKQDPPAAAELERQTAVNLLVSKGKQPVTLRMPNLVSPPHSRIEAIAKLRNMGLQSPEISEEALAAADNEMVIRQNPAPGSVVTPDDPISITIVNNLGMPSAPVSEDPLPAAPAAEEPDTSESVTPPALPPADTALPEVHGKVESIPESGLPAREGGEPLPQPREGVME
jgi:beta-lactam-binding protein with PASTA domain